MSGPTAGALAARLALDTQGFNAAMMASGKLSENELKRIQRQVKFVTDYIREMEKSQAAVAQSGHMARTAQQVAQVGQAAEMSAKQLLRANQMLPAQISDIWVSLASGQNPALVLIQQGAQIRDMYGGVGAAFRNIAAAISPTIALYGGLAAASALLLTATYDGWQEQRKFEQSLTLSGNAAGMTASRFEMMVESTAAAARSTQGAAAETVQALVATGQIGAQAMDSAAIASQRLQKFTGQTAEQVAKEFASMGRDVAKWAAENNRQYNYLTLAQYDYLKALQESKGAEAAQIENFRLLNEHLSKTVSNVGYIEGGWKKVTEWASAAYRAMMGWGKDDSTGQQIAQKQQDLAMRLARGPVNELVRPNWEKGNQRIRDEIAVLAARYEAEELAALVQAESAQKNQKAIDDRIKSEKELAKAAKSTADELKRREERMQDLLGRIQVQELAREERIQRQNAEREAAMQEQLRKMSDSPLTRDEAIGKTLRDAAKQAKDVQQEVNREFQLIEDGIVNFVKTGKLEFESLWSFMAEQYIRNLIRMVAADTMLDDAGNFKGLGNIFSGFTSWAGNLFGGSHATGLDYVPRDNYMALLHRGERVQTAAEASMSRSGAGGARFDFSGQTIVVGSGVSRPEMAAVLARNNALVEERMRRLSMEGSF